MHKCVESRLFVLGLNNSTKVKGGNCTSMSYSVCRLKKRVSCKDVKWSAGPLALMNVWNNKPTAIYKDCVTAYVKWVDELTYGTQTSIYFMWLIRFLCSYLKSLSSRVRSLISMPESLTAAIVLGNSSRAASASIVNESAALLIACWINETKFHQINLYCMVMRYRFWTFKINN